MNPIAIARLHNQKIGGAGMQSPPDVTGWMLALQGQDYYGAKWSLGLRTGSSTDEDVEMALAAKQILRTWVMRGTLHLVHAADIHWLLAIMAPRVIAMNQRRYKELELDDATLQRASQLLAKALENGESQDRKTLLEGLEKEGISTAGQRAPYLLQRASLEGLIVQVAVIHNEPHFARLPEIAPGSELPHEDALAKLAQRYFLSRGPASLRDFAWWSGLTMGDARIGLESIKGKLVQERFDDVEYWRAPGDLPRISSPTVYLLPGFDEYLLSYQDRRAIMDINMKDLAGKNGMISPTIVIDGHISGTWKRTLKKEQVEIVVKPFEPFSTAQKDAVTEAAARFGVFLDLPVVLQMER
jgi:hypothetical protein